MTLDGSGNLWTLGALTTGYIHSTGSLQVDGAGTVNGMLIAGDFQSRGNVNITSGGTLWCGTLSVSGDSLQHNIYVDGGLGLNFRGVFNSGVWYAFGWDGTALNYAINGGGQGQLYTVGQNDGRYKAIGAYTPNQNVDVWASVNWTYCNVSDLRCSGLGVFYNDTGHRVGFGWNGYLTFYVDGGYQGQFYNTDQVWGSYFTRNNAVYGGSNSYQNAWYWAFNDGTTWFYDYCDIVSDERIKENIRPIEVDVLALLRQVPVERMDIKADVIGWWTSRLVDDGAEREAIRVKAEPQHIPVGIVAQKLKAVIPDLVMVRDVRVDKSQPVAGSPLPDEDMHFIKQAEWFPYLVRAIQQLADEVDTLKARMH
jgi:hypothetical protein